MDFGFYRNQYSKYKTYVMMFNFVVLAGICFVGLFTIIHGINIFVILGVLVVLFVVHKYLSSKHKAFSSVVNIFDKTNQLKLLINERKELLTKIAMDEKIKAPDRIKAIECLNRMEGIYKAAEAAEKEEEKEEDVSEIDLNHAVYGRFLRAK